MSDYNGQPAQQIGMTGDMIYELVGQNLLRHYSNWAGRSSQGQCDHLSSRPWALCINHLESVMNDWLAGEPFRQQWGFFGHCKTVQELSQSYSRGRLGNVNIGVFRHVSPSKQRARLIQEVSVTFPWLCCPIAVVDLMAPTAKPR